ncbi:MAG TPA: DUF3800 domain-containing protein [Caldisericia bacterium]|nr:DUF3800 domain-containing protein [Caldisericia bacterium]HQL66220.1 DUF3800 domain-containing protein [Caldisericia bacterium]
MKNYRLYIDESGDHSYGKMCRQSTFKNDESVSIYYPELEKNDKRYLGITGCIIEMELYRESFEPKLEELKQKHFPYNPDDPVILHRQDIVYKHGPFHSLKRPKREKEFNEDLLLFLEEMEYTVITVVIDKKAHIENYQHFAFHPYHYCLIAILERYCGFLDFHNAKGDVLAEARGGAEDKQLKEAYRNIYNSGTQFRKPKFFHNVLTSKEIKLKPKSANIAGLQLSDLLAHPLKQEILIEQNKISRSKDNVFANKVCEIVNRKKYNREFYDGRIYGYGKVFLK